MSLQAPRSICLYILEIESNHPSDSLAAIFASDAEFSADVADSTAIALAFSATSEWLLAEFADERAEACELAAL